MNTAVRLVTDTGKDKHITPVLCDTLHWLPVQQRIIFKIAMLAFHCIRGTCPVYFKDVCVPLAAIPGRTNLRTADQVTSWCHLQKPRLVVEVSALQHPLFGIHYHFIFTMQLLANDNLNQR